MEATAQQNSIFLVLALIDRSPRKIHYRSFPVKTEIIGYSPTLDGAQNLLARSVAERDDNYSRIHSYTILELPQDKDLFLHISLAKYIYDSKGRLLESRTISNDFEDDCVFEGRDPETLRFKPGDIVEVHDEYENIIRLGVIVELPPTKEWAATHNASSIHLDDSDDSYWVVYPDDPLFDQDCSPVNVYAPVLPIHQNVIRTLEKTYQTFVTAPTKFEIIFTTAKALLSHFISTLGWDQYEAQIVKSFYPKMAVEIQFDYGHHMFNERIGPISGIIISADKCAAHMPRVQATLARIAGLKPSMRPFPIEEMPMKNYTTKFLIL